MCSGDGEYVLVNAAADDERRQGGARSCLRETICGI